MEITSRKVLMSGLLLAFAVQTTLVYTDDTAQAFGRLDSLAARGRALWHTHNCQTCHQIHGFGGFLGPDLTNAAGRIDRARLDHVLTRGSLQMPAYRMTAAEIDAIEAFLRALHRTGVGQARARAPLARDAVLEAIGARAAEQPMSEAARRGFETFRSRCIACHVPLGATPLGPHLAPDPAGIATRLDAERIDAVLRDGRVERGMPPSGLDADARRDVAAFLGWLAEQRDALDDGRTSAALDLPWWEFR